MTRIKQKNEERGRKKGEKATDADEAVLQSRGGSGAQDGRIFPWRKEKGRVELCG
jgi:hypothetical protein